MTTDLDDVFTSERVWREKTSENHFVDDLIVFNNLRKLRCSRFDLAERGHLRRDIDRVWTTQTNDSKSSAASWRR